jgi:drug/metabolite transporter (DMT)-like permease
MLLVSVALGDLAGLDLGAVSATSWASLAYLIIFGSLVGFSSYLWLVRHVRTSLVSTYAYVNPVVAVLLGWLIRDETITARVWLAGAIILASVALIVSSGGTRRTDIHARPFEEPEAVA